MAESDDEWWMELPDVFQQFIDRACAAKRIQARARLFLRACEQCPVCCEQLTASPHIRLGCGHELHKNCLFKWGDLLIERSMGATCPLCRDAFRCLRFAPEPTKRLFIGRDGHRSKSYKRQRGPVEVSLY